MRLSRLTACITVAWVLYLLLRMVTMRKQEINLTKYNDPLPDGPGSLGINAPRDAPVNIRLYRLMDVVEKRDRGPDVMGLKGHVVELDCDKAGVKIMVRLEPGGVVKVFAEDAEGTVKLEEWA